MSGDLDQYRDTLNAQVDGGGCTETWSAAQSVRRADGSDTDLEVSSGRRNVMKSALAGVAATGLAGLLGSGTAEARTPDQPSLDGPAHARSVVRESAGDVLQKLSERDILTTPTVEEFGIERLVPIERYAVEAADGVATVGVGLVDGEPVPELEATRRTDDHEVVLRVDPDTGRSYAQVTRLGTDGETVTVRANGVSSGECSAPLTRKYTFQYCDRCAWFESEVVTYCCGYVDGVYRCEFEDRDCVFGC